MCVIMITVHQAYPENADKKPIFLFIPICKFGLISQSRAWPAPTIKRKAVFKSGPVSFPDSEYWHHPPENACRP